MAIVVDGIFLSLKNDDGEYLTANVYTVDGVYEADNVTPRRLSIGQLVMALCLQRAAELELDIVKKRGAFYSYQDLKLGQGRDKSIDFLNVNPELCDEIEEKIRDFAKDAETPILQFNSEDEDDDDDDDNIKVSGNGPVFLDLDNDDDDDDEDEDL